MRLPASPIANISKILCFFDFSHQSCLLGDHLACKLTQKCSINQIWTKKYSRLIVDTIYFPPVQSNCSSGRLQWRPPTGKALEAKSINYLMLMVAAIGGSHCKTNDNRGVTPSFLAGFGSRQKRKDLFSATSAENRFF